MAAGFHQVFQIKSKKRAQVSKLNACFRLSFSKNSSKCVVGLTLKLLGSPHLFVDFRSVGKERLEE